VSELGGLDVLVNNAAVAWPRTLEGASDAELAAMIGTPMPPEVIAESILLLRDAELLAPDRDPVRTDLHPVLARGPAVRLRDVELGRRRAGRRDRL